MEDKRTKILVVDDEPEVASTLKNFLSIKGFEVSEAASGETALRIMENKKFDLVLLDIVMHGIMGSAIAKTIKDKYPATKIIIVTAYPEEGINISKDVIIDGIFIKPFGLEALYDKLLSLSY